MAFNALHTVLEAAVNSLLAAGLCAEVSLTMSPRYELTDAGIMGANYRVECVKRSELRVTFTPPDKREDGTPLSASEIKLYELDFKNGCVSGVTVTHDDQKSAPAVSCYE